MTTEQSSRSKGHWINQPIAICLISTLGIFLVSTFYQWNQNRTDRIKYNENKVMELSLEISIRSASIITELNRIESEIEQPEQLNHAMAGLLQDVIQNTSSSKLHSIKSSFIREEYRSRSIYSLLYELEKYIDSKNLRTTLTILGSYYYVGKSLEAGDASKPGSEYLKQLRSILEFQIPVEYSSRLQFPYKTQNTNKVKSNND